MRRALRMWGRRNAFARRKSDANLQRLIDGIVGMATTAADSASGIRATAVSLSRVALAARPFLARSRP